MAGARIPGSTCLSRGTPKIDRGTLSRSTSPKPKPSGHKALSKATAPQGVRVIVRDLQKSVRPLLYHVAYARAASESDLNDPNISASLAQQETRATEYCKQYVEAYLRAYMKNSAAGEAYLDHMLKAKDMYLQQWRDNALAAQQARDTHLKILNTVAAGLETLKSAGMISAAILTFIAPAAGKPLSLAFTGVDIYADVEKQSNTPVLLVVTKDVGKEVVKKAAEKAAEKASEHLAQHVEDQAVDLWFETVSKAPWGNVSQPTDALLGSFKSADYIKMGGKSVGVAFTAYDIIVQLKENYEAWKTVFEGEGEGAGETPSAQSSRPGSAYFSLPLATP